MRLLRRIEAWGLPPPTRQLIIRDEHGRRVARVDAGWVPDKVLLEYQGEEFHGPRRVPLDDERRAQLEALGWTVVWVKSVDLRLGAARLRTVLTDLVRHPAAA